MARQKAATKKAVPRKKPAKKPAKKRGRPEKRLPLDQLEELAAIYATYDEIAGFFGINRRTVIRRMKLPAYRDAYENGLAKGRISLRRSQFALAEKNATMAIFLGKQYLGQKDQTDIEVKNPEDEAGKPIPFTITFSKPDVSDAYGDDGET